MLMFQTSSEKAGVSMEPSRSHVRPLRR